MQISANGDAPGANQMVEGPVIDPTTDTMMTDSIISWGYSLIQIAGVLRQYCLQTGDIMGLLELFLIQLLLMLLLTTLHILKVSILLVKKAVSFKCAIHAIISICVWSAQF